MSTRKNITVTVSVRVSAMVRISLVVFDSSKRSAVSPSGVLHRRKFFDGTLILWLEYRPDGTVANAKHET